MLYNQRRCFEDVWKLDPLFPRRYQFMCESNLGRSRQEVGMLCVHFCLLSNLFIVHTLLIKAVYFQKSKMSLYIIHNINIRTIATLVSVLFALSH